ncbi:DUF2635 domain-containing protein [Roseomonas xinghualingensis]|uniref:DUF2635 domain-containing protein n=1 Tax=Roseomonas xinghualingensis TaxID=2986475 RepID=UPI0021F1A7E2|nr:DUF2635 domain-containing protein [Roseomonas sp. SXEYE001]MCV4206918.1 DUF2635 domain-containing protein [Roseomonas sp. SXEYE001]
MYLKPVEGRRVPDPVLRDFLPPEGRLVTRSEHFLRMVRDGDAVECDPPAPLAQAGEGEGA